MRLRRKPWIDEAILELSEYVVSEDHASYKGKWNALFENPSLPLHVEFGTGKGAFIDGMSDAMPDVNFLGFEMQAGVLYYAAKKLHERGAKNAKVAILDVEDVEAVLSPGEAARIYINFCDPWPKARHAKRRLTYRTFLERYRRLLAPGGEVHFKTDNEALFAFSEEEFRMCGWTLNNVTYDLHATDLPNVKTEYEAKFSAKGQPIFRLEAKP